MGKLFPLSKLTAIAIAVSSAAHAEEAEDVGGAQDLDVIVVSGSKIEKPLKDVAGSISVISAEDIENQGITDMSQLFRYDPSIQVTGSVGGAQNIVVRGMGSDRVLMIKDGMRMNEGYGADGANDIVGRGFIDTDTLKQVEVAKGAASSLYGSDALGGIVVFTTKDASDYLEEGESFAGKVKLGRSGLGDQTNGSATLALATGEVEHLLNASYRTGEEAQNFEETKNPFEVDSTSLLYKAKWNLSDNQSLSFIADLYTQDNNGNQADGLLAHFRGLAPFGYNITDESIEVEKENNSYQLRYESSDKTAAYDYLSMRAYHNHTQQDTVEYGQIDINAPMFGVIHLRDMWKTASYEQNTNGFLSHASKKLNDTHTIGYGLDIENTESARIVDEYREADGVVMDGFPRVTNKFPTTDTSRAGLFVNDEVTLLDGTLTVTPGVRFDMYEMDPNGALDKNGEAFEKIDENHTSFNLGALYNITDSVSVYAQYGQGFKVPAYDLAYIEHYNNFGSYIYEVVPSENLSPEESDTWELGIRAGFDSLAFDAAIYYNEYENFLTTTLIDTEMFFDDMGNFLAIQETFQYQNIDAVTIKGAEAGLTYYANDALSVFANISYQDGKDDTTDEYINSISPLSGVAGIAYESEQWATELVLNWARRMTKVNEGNTEVAGYGTVDWLFNIEFNNDVKLNVAVNNLLDKEYIQYGAVSGHAEGNDLSFFTEPGRTVNASISYNF